MEENLNREIAVSLTVAADMRQQARMAGERSAPDARRRWLDRARTWRWEARRLIALRAMEQA